MKSKFLLVLILLPTAVFPQQTEIEKYTEVATEIASWLTDVGIISPTQASWYRSVDDNTRLPGIEDGSAGTGLFFLKLYQLTEDAKYIEIAKKAGTFVHRELTNANKIENYGPDWLYGRAGGISYLVELHKVTDEQIYLDKAEEIATILLEEAINEGNETHWVIRPGFEKVYTGLPHGSSGIGLSLLQLYEVTDNTIYLDVAKKAMNWLNGHRVNIGTGIGWKRLTTDSHAYHHWSGGTVGIMQFLQKLYEITQNPDYLNQIEQAADGLVQSSIRVNDGFTWTYRSDKTGSFPVIFSHGTASVVWALLQSYSLTNNPVYQRKALDGIKWLNTVKVQNQNNLPFWPHIEGWDQFNTGYRLGTASIGHSFIEYTKLTQDSSYLNDAKKAAEYLLDIADKPKPDQLRWINYTNDLRTDFGPKTYKTGWYTGAAGIGIFFIELSQILKENMAVTNEIPHEIPSGFRISSYPNPFNPTTNVEISVPASQKIQLSVVDVLGRNVKILVNKNFSEGIHQISWDASNLPSGVYFIIAKGIDFQTFQKVTLLK